MRGYAESKQIRNDPVTSIHVEIRPGHPGTNALKMEQDAIAMLRTLADSYQDVVTRFPGAEITYGGHGEKVTSVDDFCRRVASGQPRFKVAVKDGDHPGLSGVDIIYKDDLAARELREWDSQRDGSCGGCENFGYLKPDDAPSDYGFGPAQGEKVCEAGVEGVGSFTAESETPCPEYKAKRVNADGKPARSVAELIAQALKEQEELARQ